MAIDRAETGAPQVAYRVAHGIPASRNVHGVPAGDQGHEGLADQLASGGVGVGIAQTRLAAGLGVNQHDGGRVPSQRAVGFGMIGGHGVGGDGEIANRDPAALRHAFSCLIPHCPDSPYAVPDGRCDPPNGRFRIAGEGTVIAPKPNARWRHGSAAVSFWTPHARASRGSRRLAPRQSRREKAAIFPAPQRCAEQSCG